MPGTKFGANRMNRSEVIAFLSVFPVSSVAILDFAKWHSWPFRCLGGVKTKHHAKFGENRTNGSKVTKVFVKSKMAAGGHFVFSNFTISGHLFVADVELMLHIKFG
jgi:hypothetical protein